jgi:hypothetical protein
MCLDTALLMELKVGQTEDMKTTDVITSLGVSFLSVGVRSIRIYYCNHSV